MREKIDYARKLSSSELEWLRAFEVEFEGKGKSDGSERCREAYRADKRRRRSIERNCSREDVYLLNPGHSLTPELLYMAKEAAEKLPPRKKSA